MLNASQITTLTELIDEQIERITNGELSGFDGGSAAEVEHLYEIRVELERSDRRQAALESDY